MSARREISGADDLAEPLDRLREAASKVEAARVLDRARQRLELVQSAAGTCLAVATLLEVEIAWLSGELLKEATPCPGCWACPHSGGPTDGEIR